MMVSRSDPAAPQTGIFASLFTPIMPSYPQKGRSTTCEVTGSLCPGIIVGCSLCGMFSPGTCYETCLVAGFYCGSTGYICSFAATDDADEQVDDEDVEIPDAQVEEVAPESENPQSSEPTRPDFGGSADVGPNTFISSEPGVSVVNIPPTTK